MTVLGTKHNLPSSIFFFPSSSFSFFFSSSYSYSFLTVLKPFLFSFLLSPFFFLSSSFFFFLSSSLFFFGWMQWYAVLYMVHSSFVLIFFNCLFEIKVYFKVDVSYFGETVFNVRVLSIDILIKYLFTNYFPRNVCVSRHLWEMKG